MESHEACLAINFFFFFPCYRPFLIIFLALVIFKGARDEARQALRKLLFHRECYSATDKKEDKTWRYPGIFSYAVKQKGETDITDERVGIPLGQKNLREGT